MSQMCDVDEGQKRKSISMRMKVNSLVFFSVNANSCRTFKEATALLITHYNSTEKSRLLSVSVDTSITVDDGQPREI